MTGAQHVWGMGVPEAHIVSMKRNQQLTVKYSMERSEAMYTVEEIRLQSQSTGDLHDCKGGNGENCAIKT